MSAVPDLMGCLNCPAEYEVGLRACPQCGTRSPMYEAKEGDDDMPTITSGGPSNAAEEPAEVVPEPAAAPANTENEALAGENGPELVQLPEDQTVMSAADYAAMKAAELRDEAKNRGLPASGSKAELAGRLAEHDEAVAGGDAEPMQEQDQP